MENPTPLEEVLWRARLIPNPPQEERMPGLTDDMISHCLITLGRFCYIKGVSTAETENLLTKVVVETRNEERLKNFNIQEVVKNTREARSYTWLVNHLEPNYGDNFSYLCDFSRRLIKASEFLAKWRSTVDLELSADLYRDFTDRDRSDCKILGKSRQEMMFLFAHFYPRESQESFLRVYWVVSRFLLFDWLKIVPRWSNAETLNVKHHSGPCCAYERDTDFPKSGKPECCDMRDPKVFRCRELEDRCRSGDEYEEVDEQP